MTEKELIAKIKKLQSIEPEKDWVLSTKTLILGEVNQPFSLDPLRTIFLLRKPAFAVLFVFFVLMGTFGFAQNSLPGDLLFPLKRVTERSKEVFVSEEERPWIKLELANKRLEELTRVAESNNVKKLAPAIEEFEASVSEAARELSLSLPKELVGQRESDVRKIVEEAERLEVKKEKVRALGVVVETEKLDSALAKIVEAEIKELEEKPLTETQVEILEKAKEDFEKGDWSGALEKILILPQ